LSDTAVTFQTKVESVFIKRNTWHLLRM
jgi:hypothetical protein